MSVQETRFAFWGRVSTEDHQDVESSHGWQITRARHLIEPLGGRIVAEFFDIDKSRSIPPQRRPQASALLAALADTHRGFEAVVVGEPQRAFYGNQFGNTFPLFTHYGIPLWVPEVGGPIDPDNEAHELIMSVFGGLSKGERNRIRLRVRTAMAAQAQLEGRFLGGRPPYGYRLVDAGPHPNPAKAADGRRLHALAIDRSAAPVVQRIFTEFAAGYSLDTIANQLTTDGIPCPSAHDRQRNPHRSGLAWSKSAVRAILLNPRYTGRQVWNRQRKDEVLIDVHDVTLGHTTRQRWNDVGQWIYSDQIAHDRVVDDETFCQAQHLLATKRDGGEARRPRPSARPYALRGLLFCGLCHRRMQGSWNNNMIYYRCLGRAAEAGIDQSAHPRGVFLQERTVTPKLNAWLAEAVESARLPSALADVIAALHDPGTIDRARLYAQFGLHMTYDPEPKSIIIRAEPSVSGASIVRDASYRAVVAENTLYLARLMNEGSAWGTPRSADRVHRLAPIRARAFVAIFFADLSQ
jgi:site-specific DNA recombinase